MKTMRVNRLSWKQLCEILRLGAGNVYFRDESYRVVIYRGKPAIVDAKTGQLRDRDLNGSSYPMGMYYAVMGEERDDAPKANNQEKLKLHLDGVKRSEAIADRKRSADRHRREYHSAGITMPQPKKQGKANQHSDIGKYVNKRGTFTVDEFAAIHARFKAAIVARVKAAQARAEKK